MTRRVPGARPTVVTVDPADVSTVSSWFETFTLGLGTGREDPPSYTLAEAAADLAVVREHMRVHALLALAGGLPVGAARLELPTRDNTRLLSFRLAVPPGLRGKGIGSALHHAVTATAVREGRSSLLTHLDLPLDGPDGPGAAFATARGYTLRNTELRQRLRLPADEDRLRSLATPTAAAADCRIVSWSGRCPDRYARRYAFLRGMLLGEAPTGALRLEAEQWDVARLRAEERLNEQQGRTVMTSMALAPDGSAAGHTVLAAGQAGHAFQWDTLVLPGHRGRGLGILLKAVNLLRLQRDAPSTVAVETTNATQNVPMRAINDRLGFTPLERCEDWQRDAPHPRPATPEGGKNDRSAQL
ncbi:GNAT family N-acetyltransferase [Streptomyces sp. NPDC096068]|uniref:GNAT family N-acetyltransferase n=1 Tax=Streptomyces sp. NPDC096068 TaxID=3155424 RepID=UPI00332E944C